MKSVRKYEKGGKQKGTVRAGKDYTNDKQAIAAGVTIDYSDPFRNLTEKDRAFLKKNVEGYVKGGGSKVRLGSQQDGGYFSPQSVANMRKSLLKKSLSMQGKAGQGKQKVVGGPSIPMSAPFGYEPKKEKTKERIEGTRVIGPDEEGGKGRKDNVLIRTGDKEEIRKEVQGAMDAARKKMLKK